jgi:hypothetical protein
MVCAQIFDCYQPNNLVFNESSFSKEGGCAMIPEVIYMTTHTNSMIGRTFRPSGR